MPDPTEQRILEAKLAAADREAAKLVSDALVSHVLRDLSALMAMIEAGAVEPRTMTPIVEAILAFVDMCAPERRPPAS